MTSIKISFGNEIRRILLGTAEARGLSSFASFTGTITSLFPQLANKSIFLTYIDDKNEKITVSSDAELQEAIRILKFDCSQKVLRFDIQPVVSETSSNASVEVAIHHHVTCDDCGMNPIRGIRYKCTVRDDYDLCEKCEAKCAQPYSMIKITQPRQAPPLFHAFRDLDGPAHCPWRRGGCRRNAHPAAPIPSTTTPSTNPACAANAPSAPVPEEPPRWKARWERRSERCGRRLNETVAPFISAFDKMVQNPKTIVSEGPQNVAKAFSEAIQGLSDVVVAAIGDENEPATATSKTAGADQPMASWEDQLLQEAIQESILLNEVATAFADVDKTSVSTSSATASAAAEELATITTSTASAAPVLAPSQQSTTPLPKPALRFIKDVTFPDGSCVQPAASFRKVWRVRNDGSFAWPMDAVLVPAGGDIMCGEEVREVLPILGAGEEREIGFDLVAPTRPGLYTAYFRAQTKEKQFFGHRLWATVLVSEPVVLASVAPVTTAAVAAPVTPTVSDEGWTNVESTGSNSSPPSPPAVEVVRVESVDSEDNNDAAVKDTKTSTKDTNVQPLHLLWRKELAILADMGFYDVDASLPLLQQHLNNTPVSLLGNNAVPNPEGMQRVIGALLGV